MEISQITGAGKDPVASPEEDQQLKNIGAIPAVQSVKKDSDSQQSTPEQQHAPSFEHLRQEPLQLLLRAVTTRLHETFGITPAARPVSPVIEQKLTPELASARILILLNWAFENYKTAQSHPDFAALSVMFLKTANDALEQCYAETRLLLGNLGMLEGAVAHEIDTAINLIQKALPRIPEQIGHPNPP